MELRRRPRAQHRRGLGVHPSGLHRRHARVGSPGARQVRVGALHAACRAANRRSEFLRRLRTASSGRSRMSLRAGRIAAAATPRPGEPLARPVLLHGGNAGYFHGREEEAAELARRVQRKHLTVLFGQSGLGKTSLLRAGLVPRLRGEGYCPVYVRMDYARLAAAVGADQAGHFPRHRGGRALDEARHGDPGRVALGVPAPSGRPPPRRERPHADAAADLRPVRGDLHARAGG